MLQVWGRLFESTALKKNRYHETEETVMHFFCSQTAHVQSLNSSASWLCDLGLVLSVLSILTSTLRIITALVLTRGWKR
jgi:hypothetical protein